jgi:hypothetical protein
MLSADRSAVRRLRQRVRAAVKASPALRRQRRAVPTAWRRQRAWSVLRWVVPLGVFAAAATGFPVERLVALGVLWTLCVTFWRAAQVAAVGNPDALWIPYHWPVENAVVFDYHRTGWLRSAGWLAFDWLALGAGFAVRGLGAEWWALAPLLAWSQGAVALAVALWAVRRAPRVPFGGGATLCWMLLIVCSQLYENHGAYAVFVGPLLAALRWLTPGGWLATAMSAAAGGAVWGWFVLVALGLAATLAIRPGLAALRDNFSLEAIFGYDDQDNPLPAFATDAGPAGDEPAEPAFVPPADPVDVAALRARTAAVLTEPAALAVFSRGPFEQVLVRLLSQRQRVLLDYLRPSALLSWGRGWCFALAAVVAARLLLVAGFDEWWGVLTAALGLGLLALPLFGGTWRGFDGVQIFGARVGVQSFLPVGFWEIARVRLAVCGLRTLAAWPLLVLAIRYGVVAPMISWEIALDYSLRLSALVLAVQPVWVVAAFSQTTNDTSSRWWVTLLIGLGLLGTVFGALILGVLTVAMDNFAGAATGCAALLCLTHAGLVAYGWAMRRGWFDLVAVAK